MPTFDQLIFASLRNRPDINEPQPFGNRKETIYGLTLSFLILSWAAVLFRLWVRLRIVREPGWDDALVLVAAACNTAATALVCISVQYGFGQHMLYIGEYNLEKYFLYFYLEHSLYLSETAIIKMSLLIQLLRIFKAGAMRWTCIVLLVVVTVWGLGFSITGWFPCFPIQATWHRSPNAKCYGFGLGDLDEFIAMFKAHSASNMALDLAIFITPLVLFSTPNLKARNLLAMTGVFTFGATVVATSVWRLYNITAHQATTYPYIDFTWWSPPMIILSCIEIDLAIICASMPIFWPIIEQSLAAIRVSYEVNVTEERVDHTEYGLAYELEHTMCRRSGSMKSRSGESIECLTNDCERDGQKPQYSIGVDPLSDEGRIGAGFQASVQSKPKPKWAM